MSDFHFFLGGSRAARLHKRKTQDTNGCGPNANVSFSSFAGERGVMAALRSQFEAHVEILEG
jgi:hypothetical protein